MPSKSKFIFGLVCLFSFFCGLHASDRLNFPHYADGGSSSGFWVTEIVFQNASNTTSKGFFHFYWWHGPYPIVTFRGQRWSANQSIYYELQGGESAVLTTTGEGPQKTGWVEFVEESGSGGLIGSLTFTFYENPTTPKTDVSVPPGPMGQSFVIPVEYSADSNTGIAIANPLIELPGRLAYAWLDVALLLIDSAGNLVRSAKILGFGGKQHSAKFIDEFLPGLPAPFKGSLIVVVANSSGNAVSTAAKAGDDALVLGLKLKNGLFSSIPATRAFFLPGVTLRTIETTADNNSPTSAQFLSPLPASVDGGISEAGDRDFYSFSLVQNNLLIAHLERVGAQGTLTPELTIRDSTTTLQTFLPGEPIFFRAPVSGTFYVEVGDKGNNDIGAYRLTIVRVQ